MRRVVESSYDNCEFLTVVDCIRHVTCSNTVCAQIVACMQSDPSEECYRWTVAVSQFCTGIIVRPTHPSLRREQNCVDIELF